MASNLRQKKQKDYRVLHESESLRLGKETRSTPEVLDSTFYVERLISKKRDNGKSVLFQSVQYLVKWKDFSIADCTWEPQRHLPEHVIVNFVPTQIDEDRLKVFSVAFERAVHGRLKSKNPV